MLKILDETNYSDVYQLLITKKKIAEYDYVPKDYDRFVGRIKNSTTTTIFLEYKDDQLLSFLSTRTLFHTFPAWYAHLIVVQNNLPLRSSWQTQANLYDYAINYYEQQHNIMMFFYLQPVRYEKCLNVPVRKYSKTLKTYKSVYVDTVLGGEHSKYGIVNSMLNQTVPKVDTSVILKLKEIHDD